MNFTNIKENLIVAAIFMGMLIPLRFVFYETLSKYWIGTFGLTSIVIFTIFYLSKKGKLGKIGNMIIRRFERRARGKFSTILICQSLFMIYFMSLVVMGCTYAQPEIVQEVHKEFQKQGITDFKSLSSHAQPQSTQQVAINLLILLTPNPLSFLAFKITNDLMGNWLLPFATVFLIEEIEVLGIFIYFKLTLKTPKEKTI